MKKILLVALAAAAMVGCSQNEEIDNISKNAAIKVAPVVKGTTRAAIVDNTNFTAFTVNGYAVETNNIAASGVGTAFMSQDYTGGQNAWATTSNEAYWPLSKAMQFFAYPTGSTYNVPATGYPTIDFSIATMANAQTDLVVAHATLAAKPTDNALSLVFKHILTRINFSYTPDDADCTYTVSKIMINGVQGGNAKYTFNEDKGSWSTGSEAAVDYEYAVNSTPVAAGGSYKLDPTTNGSLMLLPQDVADKTITITYKTEKGGEIVFDGSKDVTLPTNAKWGIGQNIRYNLTLPVGAEKITVTASVENANEDPIEEDAK